MSVPLLSTSQVRDSLAFGVGRSSTFSGVPGQCDGRCFGIVDFANLPELVDAVQLLTATCWTSADQQGQSVKLLKFEQFWTVLQMFFFSGMSSVKFKPRGQLEFLKKGM